MYIFRSSRGGFRRACVTCKEGVGDAALDRVSGFGFALALRQGNVGGCGFDYVSAGLSASFVARHNYVIRGLSESYISEWMGLSRAKQVSIDGIYLVAAGESEDDEEAEQT